MLHSVAPPGDGTCVFDPGSDVILTRGLYDVSGRTGYLLAPVLLNNLVARTAAGGNTNIEDGELRLEPQVDVAVHLPGDVVDRLGTGVSRSFSSYVATDSLDPGEQYVAPVDLLSPELSDALATAVPSGDTVEMLADIKFYVTRTGNSRRNAGVIDVREYSFPVDLCSGCLPVTCASCPDETCPADLSPSQLTGVCGRFQDGPLYPVVCGPSS